MVGTLPEESDVISSRPRAFKIESIYIDLSGAMDKESPKEEKDCQHFSIRGYTAEMRNKDMRRCVTLEIDDNQKNWEEKEKETEEANIVLPPLVIRKFRWWKCPKCLGLCTAEAAATEVIATGAGSELPPPSEGVIIVLSDSDATPEDGVNQENADPKSDEMETNPSVVQKSNPEEGSVPDQENGSGIEKNQEIAHPTADRMESDSPLPQKSHTEVAVPGQENGSGNENQEIVPPSSDRMESDPPLVQKSPPEGAGSAPTWKGKGVVEYGEPSCGCATISEEDDDYHNLLETVPENDWILIEKSDDGDSDDEDEDDDFFDDEDEEDDDEDEDDDNYPRNDRKMRHLNELSAPIKSSKERENNRPSAIVSDDDDDLLVSQLCTPDQGRRLAVQGNRKKSTPILDGGRSELPQPKIVESKKNGIKIGNAEKVDGLVLKESNKRDATRRKKANSSKNIVISDSDSDYDYEEEEEEDAEEEEEEEEEVEEEESPLVRRTHRGRNKKPGPQESEPKRPSAQEAVVSNKGKRPYAKRGKSINMGITIPDSAVNLGGITRSRRTPRRTIKKPTQLVEKSSTGGSDGGGISKPAQSEERKCRFVKNVAEKVETPKKSCGGSRIFQFDLNEEAPEVATSPTSPRQRQQAEHGTAPTEVKTANDFGIDSNDYGPNCTDDLDLD